MPLTHLIPYAGRNPSGTYDCNLLCGESNLYVMDNHRAAAWCWGQHVEIGVPFSIFHMDRHYDLLRNKWMIAAAPPIDTLTMEAYLSHQFEHSPGQFSPLFRYDNYLPIFLDQRRFDLDKSIFMTHEDGDAPQFLCKEKLATENPHNVPYWLNNGSYLDDGSKFIFNLDLDYIFNNGDNETYYRMFTDDHIVRIGKYWKEANAAGLLSCTTIAISPETCGGWEAGIEALQAFCSSAEITLPDF